MIFLTLGALKRGNTVHLLRCVKVYLDNGKVATERKGNGKFSENALLFIIISNRTY